MPVPNPNPGQSKSSPLAHHSFWELADLESVIIPSFQVDQDTNNPNPASTIHASVLSQAVSRPQAKDSRPTVPLAAASNLSSSPTDSLPEISPRTRQPAPQPPPPVLSRPPSMRASTSFENYTLHSVELELRAGDTLVYVDLPSNSRRAVDCHGLEYKSSKFRVHSEKLLATGSSKFADLLKPSYQFRVQRRRKVVNQLPEGVNYVLDLTPPFEGDELVFQMTELSLTPGIINWWTANALQEVDKRIVRGHDDVCSCRLGGSRRDFDSESDDEDDVSPTTTLTHLFQTVASKTVQSTQRRLKSTAMGTDENTEESTVLPPCADLLLQMKTQQVNEVIDVPNYRRVPDYCPVRHCNGIIRLLMLIEEKDVHFDSALKVWTMVAISKIFDCTSVVRDRVAQWCMHGANTKFIEVLPEEALQIGFALELPQVTQAAYRILVNELALDNAATETSLKGDKNLTVFGRRRQHLPDELSNLVQHAALAMVERVSTPIAQFLNSDVLDFWGIDEWNKLRTVEQLLQRQGGDLASHALAKIEHLMRQISQIIPNTFKGVLRYLVPLSDQQLFPSIDDDRATYTQPQNFEPLTNILKGLNTAQRMLCAFPYFELANKWQDNLFAGKFATSQDGRDVYFLDLATEVDAAVMEVLKTEPLLAQSSSEWAGIRASLHVQHQWDRLPAPSLIDFDILDTEVKDIILPFTRSWLRHDVEPPLNISRHLLLVLTSDEFKYLPPWAGGRNDGTGSVFETYVPPTDMGPNGPGPAFHTGLTLSSAPPSMSGSLIDDINTMKICGSTTQGSVDNHDSVSTVYNPNRVIAEDQSVPSEAFTSGGSDYGRAEFHVPAEHQGMGAAVDQLVDEATDNGSFSDGNLTGMNETPTTPGDDEMSDSDGSMVLVERPEVSSKG